MPDAKQRTVFSSVREEDGSPHVEKNYIGTLPLISERADIILILKSRAESLPRNTGLCPSRLPRKKSDRVI